MFNKDTTKSPNNLVTNTDNKDKLNVPTITTNTEDIKINLVKEEKTANISRNSNNNMDNIKGTTIKIKKEKTNTKRNTEINKLHLYHQ